MQPKHLASLIEKIEQWLDENGDEFILNGKTGEHMANAAATVLDAMQEAAKEEQQK